jgi:hypothetical protein|tara:strand:- start:689 stop:1051 length:363 start_codon:yes stop_codon:yes gene_type:complete
MNKTITTNTRVRLILEGSENARNESGVCVCVFWSQEINELGYNINDITASTMLDLIMQKKLTSGETIRRTKRKIQEEIVDLRGSNYKHRIEVLEPHIREKYRKTAREKHEEEIQRRMLNL